MELQTFQIGIAILGFAISIATFVDRLRHPELRKTYLVTVALVTLMLLSMVVVYQAWRYKDRVNEVSYRILLGLEPGVKTIDELREEFRDVEYPIFVEAFNDLVKNGKVGHRPLMLMDVDGVMRSRLERFKCVVYYVQFPSPR